MTITFAWESQKNLLLSPTPSQKVGIGSFLYYNFRVGRRDCIYHKIALFICYCCLCLFHFPHLFTFFHFDGRELRRCRAAVRLNIFSCRRRAGRNRGPRLLYFETVAARRHLATVAGQ